MVWQLKGRWRGERRTHIESLKDKRQNQQSPFGGRGGPRAVRIGLDVFVRRALLCENGKPDSNAYRSAGITQTKLLLNVERFCRRQRRPHIQQHQQAHNDSFEQQAKTRGISGHNRNQVHAQAEIPPPGVGAMLTLRGLA